MSRLKLALAALGWAAVLGCLYLTLPLFGLLSLAGWLVLGGCVTGALVATAAALADCIRHRAFGWAAGVAATAVLVCVGAVVIHWGSVYLDSQLAVHRRALAELAGDFRADRLGADPELPWNLRYLSIDGHAHRRGNALYLPMWQDWRAESGGGIAYFPDTPGPDTLIATAAGDMGSPSRALGDGWWWVD